jgi:nucleotide-binding universal stress UspA family protein
MPALAVPYAAAPPPLARRGRAARRVVSILVATDGRGAAESVVRVAARLGARLSVVPQAVTVLEPIPTLGAPVTGSMADLLETLERERAQAVRETVRRQLELGGGAAWPTEVVVGHPARQLARLARERRAKLVAVGIGRHAPAERTSAPRTALQTLRLGSQPVLVIPTEADATLRARGGGRGLSPASVRAAELACELLKPGGHALARAREGAPRGRQPGGRRGAGTTSGASRS